jgi:quercetin dioxygenase-like cupin family protein|tara:strand:+ start:376 stop:759 length:384 start_codon:yes stop_codon:yes gene_type:complete
MNLKKIDTSFHDDRGEIVDILVNEPIEFVTMITSKAGSVRGNHYHKKTFQWIYMLSGKIRVCAQSEGSSLKELIIFTGDLILNAPLEQHAFEALEDSKFLVFTRGPRGGDNYEDDTFRIKTPLIRPK